VERRKNLSIGRRAKRLDHILSILAVMFKVKF
jgi:hypothetical protein